MPFMADQIPVAIVSVKISVLMYGRLFCFAQQSSLRPFKTGLNILQCILTRSYSFTIEMRCGLPYSQWFQYNVLRNQCFAVIITLGL